MSWTRLFLIALCIQLGICYSTELTYVRDRKSTESNQCHKFQREVSALVWDNSTYGTVQSFCLRRDSFWCFILLFDNGTIRTGKESVQDDTAVGNKINKIKIFSAVMMVWSQHVPICFFSYSLFNLRPAGFRRHHIARSSKISSWF